MRWCASRELEQIPDTQFKIGENIFSADRILESQNDSRNICLPYREFASKWIDDPDLFDTGIEIDLCLAVDLCSGVAWRYDLDRKIWGYSNIRSGAFHQPPLPNESEIWSQHRIGILLEYKPRLVREELSELVRQNKHPQVGTQFSSDFTMYSTRRIRLDQFSFDEHIRRVRAKLEQIAAVRSRVVTIVLVPREKAGIGNQE